MVDTRFQLEGPYERKYGNSRDIPLEEDIVKAVFSLPLNAVNLLPFTDPKDINFDAVARIGERFIFRYYDQYTRFRENFTPFRPRKSNFWKNLRRLDLDSGNYMEDFITATDEALDNNLTKLLEKFKKGENFQSEYNGLIKRLDVLRNELLDIQVPDEKCLKIMRLQSMVEYIDLIKSKAEILKDSQWSKQNKDDALFMLQQMSDQQLMRRDGEMFENGVSTGKPAYGEYKRRLKRQFDQSYINPHRRGLPVLEPKDKAENSENFFIMTATYGFKDDGITPIPDSERQLAYTQQFVYRIAQMYRSGREHDALRAILMCKYQEGLGSIELIPGDFREKLREKLQNDFRNNGKNIDTDQHFAYFDAKLQTLENRDHAPEGDGPRDTNNVVVRYIRDYVFGRLYPGQRDGVDVYAAAPFSAKHFQNNSLAIRQKTFAYFTGGIVIPAAENERKTPAEKQCKTKIERQLVFWRKVSDKEPYNKYNGFIERAPVWFSLPLRAGMLASLPVAAVVGLVGAPALLAVPVFGLGAFAASKYTIAGTKAAWSNKILRTAMIGTGLAATAVGGTALTFMFAPALPVLALATAASMAASPVGIALIGSSTVGLSAMIGRAGMHAYKAVMMTPEEYGYGLKDDGTPKTKSLREKLEEDFKFDVSKRSLIEMPPMTVGNATSAGLEPVKPQMTTTSYDHTNDSVQPSFTSDLKELFNNLNTNISELKSTLTVGQTFDTQQMFTTFTTMAEQQNNLYARAIKLMDQFESSVGHPEFAYASKASPEVPSWLVEDELNHG